MGKSRSGRPQANSERKNAPITGVLPRELLPAFRQLAEDRGLTRSTLIRAVLEREIAEAGYMPETSSQSTAA